jgi:hypothetical protein
VALEVGVAEAALVVVMVSSRTWEAEDAVVGTGLQAFHAAEGEEATGAATVDEAAADVATTLTDS